MQLTNILRDIKEDYQRGRVYLPQNEMKQFGVTEEDIAQESLSERFISLLKHQIQRARTYYNNSAKGIGMIIDKNGRFVVCAMKDIYAGILYAIERNNYDVFSQRAHVNTPGKILLLLKIMLKGEYR
jgi:phytoene synthase